MYIRPLLLLVLLSFLAIGHVAPCYTYGYTNGCSIPGNLPFPYKSKFKSACDRHDVCYACGYKSGMSKSACDTKFYNNLRARCRSESWLLRGTCNTFAKIYYNAVKSHGHEFYEIPSLGWCSKPWVSGCM